MICDNAPKHPLELLRVFRRANLTRFIDEPFALGLFVRGAGIACWHKSQPESHADWHVCRLAGPFARHFHSYRLVSDELVQ